MRYGIRLPCSKSKETPRRFASFGLHLNDYSQAFSPCTWQALESYQRLLALSPHDLSVLKVIPPLLSATNNVNEGARLYEAAFEHYTRRPYRDDGASTSYTSWDMDLLISLADFMLLTYDFEGVIGVVKRGQRWFQGRGREAHWDLIPDDREYDPAGTERVNDAPHLGHGEGYQLDLILRHRLAVARLKLAHDEDAMVRLDTKT